MSAKEWLDKKEWDNPNIDSTIYPHYVKLDRLMEEYAKHYLKERLKYISNKTKEQNYL